MARPTALGIMAKAPEAGRVKTRLSPPLSPAETAELYRAFLLDEIETVRSVAGARPALAYTPAGAGAVFEAMARDFVRLPQRGDDLGARMSAALADLLEGDVTGAVLIGSDLPDLPREILETAVRLLADPATDAVLGPSDDGGYYLVGLSAPRPELFDGIAWSTPTVWSETMARARALGLRVAQLPAWADVDTPEALRDLEGRLATSPTPLLPHTRGALAALRARCPAR